MERTPNRSGIRNAALPIAAMTRREALKVAVLGSLGLQLPSTARALVAPPGLRLGNGLRMHLASNKSGYVSAALVLRSKEIADPRGLAHIMEHTSFTGAAGSLSAKEVKDYEQRAVKELGAECAAWLAGDVN